MYYVKVLFYNVINSVGLAVGGVFTCWLPLCRLSFVVYAPIIARRCYIVNTFCAFYGVFLEITGVETVVKFTTIVFLWYYSRINTKHIAIIIQHKNYNVIA